MVSASQARERRKQGNVAPKTTRNRRKCWEPHTQWLLAKLDEHPDIYLGELQAYGQVFPAWVQQQLVKVLRPCDIVVMDNLSSHKVKGVIEANELAGAEIRYLPSCRGFLKLLKAYSIGFKSGEYGDAQRTTEKLE